MIGGGWRWPSESLRTIATVNFLENLSLEAGRESKMLGKDVDQITLYYHMRVQRCNNTPRYYV